MLKVFNTESRKKEKFVPLQEGRVAMYCCGPTVYDVPHLGNYRSFVMSDNMRRYLEHLGYSVNQVMNITDIDDKTIKRSGELGVPLKEYTRKYEEVFFDGLRKLNILPANYYPRATENVELMLEIVQDLEKKGFAYEREGSVYFDVSAFAGYGRLSRIDMAMVKAGARVDVDEYAKDNPQDFALLKKSTESEVARGIFFESKWGKVRPGWHIECSALSMKYLGPTVDIHTGGVDLVFPHHENEIAQSESYTGKKFVRFWIHGEHLMVGGEKMSKSLGNYITLDDVLRDYPGNVVRYMFISTHYRKILDYTKEFAENAKNNYERLRNAYESILFALQTSDDRKTSKDGRALEDIHRALDGFRDAMDDDLNNPLAVGAFHELARGVNRYLLGARNRAVLEAARQAFESFAEVLGLQFPRPAALSPQQAEMIREREAARASRDWESADRIRVRLRDEGVILEDTEWGTKWRTGEQCHGRAP